MLSCTGKRSHRHTILHVSFSNSFGLASARPTPQGLSGAPYNRVKSRVTPQIDAQVNAILNQWFCGIQPAIASDAPSNNNWNNPTSYNDGWREQPVQTPPQFNTQGPVNKPRKPTTPMWDDDDVVID